eukprot:2041924-Heterocapsa_arctica.AAC.1
MDTVTFRVCFRVATLSLSIEQHMASRAWVIRIGKSCMMMTLCMRHLVLASKQLPTAVASAVSRD